ncbi:MAG TPA: hypothetical protein VFZ17_08950 [Acidimicrobiia bacterium]|nr:hypothetical protein [Acidimicrobiia bacterium]
MVLEQKSPSVQMAIGFLHHRDGAWAAAGAFPGAPALKTWLKK